MTTTALERCDIRLSSEDKAFLQLAASLDGNFLICFYKKSRYLSCERHHKQK